ncbi:MAG: septum formation protein Maf [Promethearchaeota archaeon]|nr:MAG: septum formation protein Maf [Candidatus Lokiarchaeota archaeon]
MKPIVLASKSIDRKKILNRAKIPFEILVTTINEERFKNEISDPVKLVKKLAQAKVLNAKEMLANEGNDAIIIAADTIVELNGEIIGKARDKEHAFYILKKLAGKTHNLITGITVTETYNSKLIKDYDSTKVKFLDLTEDEIWGYLETEEWKERAGAYSIREKASLFIESIQGSPSNVIGLPMNKIFRILKEDFNINLL